MTLRIRKTKKSWILTAVLIAAMLLLVPAIAFAEDKVDLGTAEDFAIIAGTTITNTGTTEITGDVGLSPGAGTAITGFPPGTVDGTIYTTDAPGPAGSEVNPGLLTKAKEDLVTAYEDAETRSPSDNVDYAELDGRILFPGVYNATTSMGLAVNGLLILDAKGNPDNAFIFQAGSTLITGSSSVIELINGATFCQVFWQVGSSATLGTNSTFVGHILALTSITANTGATVEGQLLARNGAVTLDNNTIINKTCEADSDAPTDANGTGTDYTYTGPEAKLLGTESLLRKGTDTGALAGAIELPATGGLALAQILYALGGVMMTVGGIMLKKKVK